MTKKCPSCGTEVDQSQHSCPSCAWQFAMATISAGVKSAVRASHGNTIVRGLTRPAWNCICSKACQLAVLVRDKSGSMKGQKARDASAASQDLGAELAQPVNKDQFYIGVVDFDSTAEVVHNAIKATALSGSMRKLAPGFLAGMTNITDGLSKAQRIVTSFKPPDGITALRGVAILFSDGCHNVGGGPEKIADELKQHVDIVAVAFGDDADEDLLRRIASPQMFHRCSNGAELRKFFATVGATMTATMARGMNATQALAATGANGLTELAIMAASAIQTLRRRRMPANAL